MAKVYNINGLRCQVAKIIKNFQTLTLMEKKKFIITFSIYINICKI